MQPDLTCFVQGLIDVTLPRQVADSDCRTSATVGKKDRLCVFLHMKARFSRVKKITAANPHPPLKLPARKLEPPLRVGTFEGQMNTDLRGVFIGLAMIILVFAVAIGFHYVR